MAVSNIRNDVSKHFVLDEYNVKKINALLLKYRKCSDMHDLGECFHRGGGCNGCELLMTNDEDDAAWELTEAFRECVALGVLRG